MKLPSLFPVVFFSVGILLSSKLHPAALTPRICIVAIALSLIAGCVVLYRRLIVTAAIFGVAAWLLLGFAAANFERASVPPNLASTLIETGKLDTSVALRWRGRLRSDPLQLPWGTRYEIALERVESSTGITPVTGGLRLTWYSDNSKSGASLLAHAGDEVECLARAITVRNFGNPGYFDYRGYLSRQDIQLLGTLRNNELLTIVGGHPSLTLLDRLARARGRLLDSLNELLSSRPDQTALARAMLLGDRSFVDHDQVLAFQETGVYHVLVLAGLHVGALTAFFIWAGRRLHLTLLARTLLTLAALSAYAGIVEDRPPIVRALLMAALYLSARLLFRRLEVLNIAALSALVILIARPSEISDPSFLLSFCAAGTIGALAVPWIAKSSEPYLHGLRNVAEVSRDVSHVPKIIQFRIEMRALTAWLAAHLPRAAAPLIPNLVVTPLRSALYLWELMVISAILQLGMLPALTYYFHRVTFVGPFANIPAILLTGLAVPVGFFTLATSIVFHPVAVFLAKPLGIILATLDRSVQWFAGWHGASHRIPAPPLALISVFGLVVIILATVLRSRLSARWHWPLTICLLGTACVIATFPFAPHLAGRNLELTVLDVGQGDSLFLAFPSGLTMLVDAGGELGSFHSGGMRSGIDIGEDVVSPYLWSRGIKKIDVIALTHAHEDHLGGLPAVLQNFRVRELWIGRDVQTAEYRHVLAVARERGVHIVHKKQGDSFTLDGISGNVLWPDNLNEGQTAKNDDSLVMRLTDGSQSLLLSGDIERPSERTLLAENQTVRVNFLKVPHHGSKTSTTEPFLDAVHPAFAAISVGRDNSFGHPSPEVVERLGAAGVRIYRTDRDGAITATTDGHRLHVTAFLRQSQ